MKRIGGIRKRWMVNSISVVLFVVLLAVTAFSAAMGSYFYTTMGTNLQTKAESAINSFSTYRTESSYYQYAQVLVNSSVDRDRLEVDHLDAHGLIRFSSSAPDASLWMWKGAASIWRTVCLGLMEE